MPSRLEPPSDQDLAAEIDALIEEHGDARAAIRALLHDIAVLAADREQSVLRGYVRGRRLDVERTSSRENSGG